MTSHAEVMRRRAELYARWRRLFCTCADDDHDPMCLGCAVMHDALAQWGVLGLEHMIRRVETRERALRERIEELEDQIKVLDPLIELMRSS
ncbi:hypothetical protein [Deferrisoma camini]|uniref:hypothetical protein n=1 Tax=Deferrisoma camini TaxID=1035120 RepID=UPI00046D485D|nr:hypothetical protein [Deferrisoma camini]